MTPKLLSAQTWTNTANKPRITTRWEDDLGLQFNALHDENGRVLANPRHFKAPRLTPEQIDQAVPLAPDHEPLDIRDSATPHPAYALAEKGAAAKPELAERMTKAADLVAAGSVIVHEPNDLEVIGTVKGYSIKAQSCSCMDFYHRGGWCKHRLAVRMAISLKQASGPIPFSSHAAAEAREQAAQDRIRAQVAADVRRDEQSWQRYCNSEYGKQRYIIKAVANGAKTIAPDVARRAGLANHKNINQR